MIGNYRYAGKVNGRKAIERAEAKDRGTETESILETIASERKAAKVSCIAAIKYCAGMNADESATYVCSYCLDARE